MLRHGSAGASLALLLLRRDPSMLSPAIRQELSVLSRLGLPVAAGQLGIMLLNTVDTLMLGRYGVEELAASALGTQWIFLTLTTALGCVMGIDPIVAQRHGAKDAEGTAHALQHGLIIAFFCSLLVSAAWLATSDALILMGQDPRLSHLAHRYVVLQLPSIFPFLAWAALRSYLQGQGIVQPAMWVMVPVNLVNILLNWLLIYGPGPFPELGLSGAALATCVSRCLSGGLLLLWVYFRKLHVDAWVPFRLGLRLRPHELRVPLALGLPIALQMGLEVMAFAMTALIAGQMSSHALAAHSIVLSIAALLFMTPLGVAAGLTTRVGNLIGANESSHLRTTLSASLVLGGLIIVLNVSVLTLGRDLLVREYSLDPLVRSISRTAFLVAAVFQVSDCSQVIMSGILRGMGRTRFPAVAAFVGYYVFGLPFGYYLGVVEKHGLVGLWWGLALGLTIVSVVLVARLSFLGSSGLLRHLDSEEVA